MLSLYLTTFVFGCCCVPGLAKNSIRLKRSTRANVGRGSSGVRRYEAEVQLGESMFDMTELTMGMEDTMTFIKFRSERREDKTVVWSGLCQQSNSSSAFLTISQNERGFMSGSLKSATTSYSILTHPNGRIMVTSFDRSLHKYVPAETVQESDKLDVLDAVKGKYSNKHLDLAKRIDLREPRKAAMPKEVAFGPAADLLKRNKNVEEPDQRDLQAIPITDVLVLVTNEAMCQSSELMGFVRCPRFSTCL